MRPRPGSALVCHAAFVAVDVLVIGAGIVGAACAYYCAEAGLRRRSALRAFAAAMHGTYRVPAGWQGWLADDTVICRCEEVDLRQVRRSVEELGATDPRSVKLLARPGMGLCQGRMCGYATACLVAQARGRAVTAPELLAVSSRPIAQPVSLARVAADPLEGP